jgi:hypothetical protein
MRMVSSYLKILLLLSSHFFRTFAFTFPTVQSRSAPLFVYFKSRYTATSQDAISSLFASKTDEFFPVISRIAGIDWTGTCRYVGSDLQPPLKLVGGVRYDVNGSTLVLSSFLTFPNGKTRNVQIQGAQQAGSVITKLTMDSGGPIHMLLTELQPDTILINEVDEASGNVILTSSLSIAQIPTDNKLELVQVSHEVGANGAIEGHQVWRLFKSKRAKEG